jgi:hypothetical protein
MPPLKPHSERPRRAVTLRVPLKNAPWNFVYTTDAWPRWTIDEVAELLWLLVQAFDPERIGCPKKIFKPKEIGQLVFWLLYRKCPPWESHKLALNHRQSAFFKAYLAPDGFNAARAARIAGYSPRRARQTGHELLRKLRDW